MIGTRHINKFIEIPDSCYVVTRNWSLSSTDHGVLLVDVSMDPKNGSFVLSDTHLKDDYTVRIKIEWSSDQTTNCLNMRVKKKNIHDSISFYDAKGARIQKFSNFKGLRVFI